jgi:hypothetical protein
MGNTQPVGGTWNALTVARQGHGDGGGLTPSPAVCGWPTRTGATFALPTNATQPCIHWPPRTIASRHTGALSEPGQSSPHWKAPGTRVIRAMGSPIVATALSTAEMAAGQGSTKFVGSTSRPHVIAALGTDVGEGLGVTLDVGLAVGDADGIADGNGAAHPARRTQASAATSIFISIRRCTCPSGHMGGGPYVRARVFV